MTSKNLNGDLELLKDGCISIKRFPNNATDKPEVQGCGVVFTYKDADGYGWNVAIINGDIYTRNNLAGKIGTWKLVNTK